MMDDKARRAQIAAEVAARYGCKVDAEAVQVVPRGVSGIPLPVWNGHDLVYPDGAERLAKAQARMFQRIGLDAAHQRQRADMLARREKVAQLVERGMTAMAMASLLEVSEHTIRQDCRALGVVPVRATYTQLVAPEMLARRNQALDMARDGKTAKEIASALQWKPASVRELCARYGVELVRAPRVQGRKLSPAELARIENRRDNVAALIEQGLYQAEIARRLGVASDTVKGDADARGLQIRRRVNVPVAPCRAAALAALDAEIARLFAEGKPLVEIAAAVGRTPERVRIRMLAAGLPRLPVARRAARKGAWRDKVDALRAIAGPDLTREAAMAKLGIGRRQLRDLAKEAGVKFHHAKPVPVSPDVSARLEPVAELLAQGLTGPQISERLGISRNQLLRVRRLLGPRGVLQQTGARNKGPGPLVSARRAKVLELRKQGLTGPQIAERLGVSLATVASDVTALGASGGMHRGRIKRELTADHLAQARAMIADGYALITAARKLGFSPKRMAAAIGHVGQVSPSAARVAA